MIKKILLSATFLFNYFAFSQNINSESSKIIENVKQNYQNKNSYKIQFMYELNNPSKKINQKEQGIIYSSKQKYNLTILGINQIFDGKKLYQISPEDKEVTISNASNEDVISPTKIFELYKTGFLIGKPIQTKLNNKLVQQIKLVPTDSKNKSKEIILYIDYSKKQLIQMIEKNKDNSNITLKVLSFDDKTPLNQSIFSFDKNKYKGYIITDLD